MASERDQDPLEDGPDPDDARDESGTHDGPDEGGPNAGDMDAEDEQSPAETTPTRSHPGAMDVNGASSGHEGVDEDGDSLDGKSAAELREEIRQMRAMHERALDTEARARAEVEDMCLRIEKHFQSEKARQTHQLSLTTA
jgi:hypothetical protein